MDVDGMLESIPLELFYRWMEYAAQEPFGEERADLRSAIVACVMANSWRGKSGRRFRPEDFMPKFGSRARPSRRQSVDEMKMRLRTFATAHNEALKRKC